MKIITDKAKQFISGTLSFATNGSSIEHTVKQTITESNPPPLESNTDSQPIQPSPDPKYTPNTNMVKTKPVVETVEEEQSNEEEEYSGTCCNNVIMTNVHSSQINEFIRTKGPQSSQVECKSMVRIYSR